MFGTVEEIEKKIQFESEQIIKLSEQRDNLVKLLNYAPSSQKERIKSTISKLKESILQTEEKINDLEKSKAESIESQKVNTKDEAPEKPRFKKENSKQYNMLLKLLKYAPESDKEKIIEAIDKLILENG